MGEKGFKTKPWVGKCELLHMLNVARNRWHGRLLDPT